MKLLLNETHAVYRPKRQIDQMNTQNTNTLLASTKIPVDRSNAVRVDLSDLWFALLSISSTYDSIVDRDRDPYLSLGSRTLSGPCPITEMRRWPDR